MRLSANFSNFVKGQQLLIHNGGRLIFKDYGADSQEVIKLRAKSIKIRDGGELWVGSRAVFRQKYFYYEFRQIDFI